MTSDRCGGAAGVEAVQSELRTLRHHRNTVAEVIGVPNCRVRWIEKSCQNMSAPASSQAETVNFTSSCARLWYKDTNAAGLNTAVQVIGSTAMGIGMSRGKLCNGDRVCVSQRHSVAMADVASST